MYPQNPGMPAGGPWGGLPTAQQPWSGGQQWQAAQQSPWRQSPWQTQGMPSGMPAQVPQVPQQSYLPQGQSGGIPGFNPQTPGGGFYPGILSPAPPPPPPPPQAPQQPLWQAGGQLFQDRVSANRAATTHNNLNVADGGNWWNSQTAMPVYNGTGIGGRRRAGLPGGGSF